MFHYLSRILADLGMEKELKETHSSVTADLGIVYKLA